MLFLDACYSPAIIDCPGGIGLRISGAFETPEDGLELIFANFTFFDFLKFAPRSSSLQTTKDFFPTGGDSIFLNVDFLTK